jgi:hypothetical protein
VRAVEDEFEGRAVMNEFEGRAVKGEFRKGARVEVERGRGVKAVWLAWR